MQQRIEGERGGPYAGLVWDGARWIKPLGTQAPDDSEIEHDRAVRAYYWLACVLPCLLAFILPIWVGVARSYPTHSGTSSSFDQPAMVATGWALLAVGIAGAAVGSFAFRKRRRQGDLAARKWGSSSWGIVAATFGFGLLATALALATAGPPRDSQALSPVVPINAVVESTAGGEFTVAVESIQCDWYNCNVHIVVTNNGSATATFPCDQLSATGPSGTVRAHGYSFGSDTYGCMPIHETAPGASTSLDVWLLDVHDQELVTLEVPGAEQTLDLPPINRAGAG